jgi:hypothetical protein
VFAGMPSISEVLVVSYSSWSRSLKAVIPRGIEPLSPTSGAPSEATAPWDLGFILRESSPRRERSCEMPLSRPLTRQARRPVPLTYYTYVSIS